MRAVINHDVVRVEDGVDVVDAVGVVDDAVVDDAPVAVLSAVHCLFLLLAVARNEGGYSSICAAALLVQPPLHPLHLLLYAGYSLLLHGLLRHEVYCLRLPLGLHHYREAGEEVVEVLHRVVVDLVSPGVDLRPNVALGEYEIVRVESGQHCQHPVLVGRRRLDLQRCAAEHCVEGLSLSRVLVHLVSQEHRDRVLRRRVTTVQKADLVSAR